MATNKLTDAQCRLAKPADKARKLSDGHGMFLFVTPKGAKVWRMAYTLHGKEQTEVLGPYPLLSLADARSKRDELRRKLLDGINIKTKGKASISFSDAVTAYWAVRADVSAGYKANATRGLAMHIEEFIGTHPIATITRESLLEQLARLDAAGKYVYAKRLRVWAGQVFDWAVEHGYCPVNVAGMIDPKKAFGKKRVLHHAALQLREVPDFMARLAMEDDLQSVLANKLLALTWVRTQELRFMLWSEIEGNVWRIPEGKMKKRREHLVPLSTQALELLATLKARSRGGVYVFPADHRIDRPMSENAILYLIHRIGYKGKMTGHGWRRVASTWANEGGYSKDAIEAQLAHSDDDEVRAIYNMAKYLPERRKILQDWANWLQKIDASRLQSGQAPGAGA
jgi:integrase